LAQSINDKSSAAIDTQGDHLPDREIPRLVQ